MPWLDAGIPPLTIPYGFISRFNGATPRASPDRVWRASSYQPCGVSAQSFECHSLLRSAMQFEVSRIAVLATANGFHQLPEEMGQTPPSVGIDVPELNGWPCCARDSPAHAGVHHSAPTTTDRAAPLRPGARDNPCSTAQLCHELQSRLRVSGSDAIEGMAAMAFSSFTQLHTVLGLAFPGTAACPNVVCKQLVQTGLG